MLIYIPSNKIGYSITVGELIYNEVSEGEFDDAISNNDLDIVETEEVNQFIYFYALWTGNVENVYGGQILFESDRYLGNIEFFTLNVTGINEVTEPYQTYTTTSGTEVNYTASGGDDADPLYNTVASATYKNMNYYIEYTSLNNDALEFFNAIFA